MIKKLLTFSFLIAALALCSACSSLTTEPGDPADRVIQEKAVEALGEYANTVIASTVNGRVYLSGWLSTTEDKSRAVSAVEKVEGVKEVMDDIQMKSTGRYNKW